MSETYEQQMKDSDTIFNVVTRAADNIDEAKQMWAMYAMDMNFSRAGVSHALVRLERHFFNPDKRADGGG